MSVPFFKLKTIKRLGPEDQITFGKYRGATVKQLLHSNPDYLHWCVANDIVLLTKKVATDLDFEMCKLAIRNSRPKRRFKKTDDDYYDEWEDMYHDEPFF